MSIHLVRLTFLVLLKKTSQKNKHMCNTFELFLKTQFQNIFFARRIWEGEMQETQDTGF